MMTKVATAEKVREETEISLLNSGPIGRAQVERVAALNARIEELEGQLFGRRPVGVIAVCQSGMHACTSRKMGV